MPCQTPYRGDSSQLLLFKIASCLAEGGGLGAFGVASFNGRVGVVTLTSGDVTTALGFTPISQSDGDARYVLKAGDTMTGALTIGNGLLAASAPALNLNQTWNNGAVTFNGLFANYTNTASASDSSLFNFQTDGIDRFRFNTVGQLFAARQDATNSGMSLFLRKRGNAGGATNAVAADSTVGTVQFSSWDGTAYANGSRISGLAAEAWTNIAHGARIDLYTTPVGSTTEQISLRLESTGQAKFLDGTAALPALTFQSDPDTGIYRIGANSFGLSAGGALTLAVDTTGINLTTALAYKYNSVNVIRAQTALNNYFFGPSGNLTMTGTKNVSVGGGVLVSNTSGANNTGIGHNALVSNTIGDNNISFGVSSLETNVSGSRNAAFGTRALQTTTADDSTAFGYQCLISANSGIRNSGFGSFSLPNVTTGSANTGIGYNTGGGITTGSNNTIIGANVLGLAAALSNNIILADGAGLIRLQIDSSGNTTLAGTVATAAGTAALPAHTFSADLDTGIYRVAANHLGISSNGAIVLGVGAATLGFFATVAATPVAQQVSGANLTNNVTAGGTDDTIANYTDLTIYANDAAAIRNDIYQLARKLKQVNDALRAYGLLT